MSGGLLSDASMAQMPASVRDVSRGSIALAVDVDLPADRLVHVELPATAGSPGETLLAYVVRAERLAGGGWIIACEFAADLSDAEVATLAGDAPPPPAGPDRRARPRRPADASARYYPLGCGDLTRRAAVVDLSVAGAAL